MNYQHILVALELSDDNKILIDKAVFLAKLVNAKVSLIHVDGSVGEVYPELIDFQADPTQRPLNEHANLALAEFQKYADFPISHFLVGTGNLGDKLKKTVNEHGFDLIICGHHHDFISNIVSYSRGLINKSPVDILVVPI